MKKLIKITSSALLVVLLAGVLLFAFPAEVAHAEGLADEPPTTSGERGGFARQRLQAAFAFQQTRLGTQAQNIQDLSDVSAKAQARIDDLRARGKDVASLEAALAEFEGALPAINSAHQQAADLIAAHSGFDNNGKVTDLAAAADTVENIHRAFEQAHQQMVDAARALRQAIRNYREANAPQTTPQP